MKKLILISLLLAGALASAAQPTADLQELRGQIQNVQKQLAATESDRDNVSDTLKQSEQAISDANRTLESLLTQQRELSRSTQDLANSIANKQREVSLRQAQVARLFRQRYQAGSPAAWQLWLNAENPNYLARNRRYAEYWAQSQQKTLTALKATTTELNRLLGNARNQQQQLLQVADAQKQQQRILISEKKTREHALSLLSRQIANQKQQLGKLQRDEKRLTDLMARLAELAKTRAEQKAKRDLLALRPKPSAQTANNKNAQKNRATAITVEKAPANPISPSNGLGFASLKGRLHLPINGELANRYGQNRPEGGAWKGVFIRSAPGKTVTSIAAGEVVFADWLRGFGNLIIIDHGGAYMSLYGYNETLLKQVGDTVNAGDRIAVTGASGGQNEPGLYFEIRFQGRPVDPLSWAS